MTSLSKLKSTAFTLTLTLLLTLPNISYSQTIALAMEAYENLQFDIALKSFNKVWKKNKTDNEINYMYGKCILRANTDRKEAKKHLEIVIGNDINYKDANFELGKAYVYTEEFDKARQVINYFLKNYNFDAMEEDKDEEDSKNKINLKKQAEVLLEQIKTAEQLLKNPINVSFINLGKMVNTKRSDYNPFITQDGQTIYYTSNKKYDSDLLELINNAYVVNFTPDEEELWSKMKSIGKDVNSDENEIIVGLSKDEKKIVMNVNWMKDKGDIFLTDKGKKRFQELSELEETVNSKWNEASGSLSKNNDTLYFCSNRPGGYGGQDIYMSIKLPDGTWGKPFNLGSDINTEFDETYPNINYMGNQLQFSSNRPQSMGGFDIFSTSISNGKWVNTKNLGYPINNFYDNFIISYSRSNRYGYMAQVRTDGFGGRDIYQLIFNDIPAQNIIYTGTIKKGDGQNSKIISGDIKVEAICIKTGRVYAKSKYSEKGKYTFAFPPGEFKIKITGSNFQDFEKIIRIPNNEPTEALIIKNILVN